MLSLGFIELILIFGIAFGIGGWQLWSVSKDLHNGREEKNDDL